VAVLAVAATALGGGLAMASVGGTEAGAGGPAATRAAAEYFLAHYEQPDGRVVRWNQGGDTVSEGQAYAMLVSAALGNRSRFSAAWSWAAHHLQQPTGLLAWHWDRGSVIGKEPAPDADLIAAWALELASSAFGERQYRSEASRIADAVLAHEVASVHGRPVLLAGPWARGASPILNPSYDIPAAFAALGALGRRAEWEGVAADARSVLTQLTENGNLPPDWAILTTTSSGGGVAHPIPTPDQPQAPVVYGFDAVRLPVVLAGSCDPDDRAMAAAMWRVLERQASAEGVAAPRRDPGQRSGTAQVRAPLVGLDLGGSPTSVASTSPVGLVGAAGAAQAAGEGPTAGVLLARADRANRADPTYYGSAWVALGSLMLQSSALGGCR
jgi:endoglucanase